MDQWSAELAKHAPEKAAVSYTIIITISEIFVLVWLCENRNNMPLGNTFWDMHAHHSKVSPTFYVHQCPGWWRVYHVSRETQWRRGPTLSHWRPWRCRTLSLHPWLARSVDRPLSIIVCALQTTSRVVWQSLLTGMCFLLDIYIYIQFKPHTKCMCIWSLIPRPSPSSIKLVLGILPLYLHTGSDMWQSQVEIEHYSIVHFDHITTFKVL